LSVGQFVGWSISHLHDELDYVVATERMCYVLKQTAICIAELEGKRQFVNVINIT
jgi:hypothetical protein